MHYFCHWRCALVDKMILLIYVLMIFVGISYAFFMHCLCISYACLTHFLCTSYAFFKAHKKCIRNTDTKSVIF